MPKQLTCSIKDCDRKHYGKGWCNMHYHRWYRYGDTQAVLSTAVHLSEHPAWQGDGAGYDAVHYRLRTQRGKASSHVCPCGVQAQEWAYDKPSGHSPDLSKYTPMCRSCHKRRDMLV